MYRHRIHRRVAGTSLDDWDTVLGLAKQINAVARSNGWVEYTSWTQTVGPFYEIVFEGEYPDLATFEREQTALYQHPEGRKLLESLNEKLVPDFGGAELWKKAAPNDSAGA